MNVPLLDLKAQYATIKDDIDTAIAEVMTSQYFILGPRVESCETAIAEYSDCKHAVGVSSGTDALLIALMAESVGPGDEVITSPYTFFATGGSISRLGATPVFVDIDPETYNIDPAGIETAITEKTRAIIPVHLYGQMADMDAIMDIARRNELIVIEDAAQAIGAEDKGKRAGSIGDYGCFSFFPSKNLGAAGDGGMVTVQDEARATALQKLRSHGSHPKYYHAMIGGNFRLDALQAAIVHAKLPHLDSWTEGRQRNADRYNRLIEEAMKQSDGRVIGTPACTQSRHIYNQYVVRVPNRDTVRERLKEAGVGCEVYYPVPLHLQECFTHLGHTVGDFPESERAATETIALPVFPELSEPQARRVIDSRVAALQD
jgi:dTDP-4-amino-4,6-dideoxygalactose transaminase